MDRDDEHEALDPADAHARARELLTDAFFWDTHDDASPFGGETGSETLALFRDDRDEQPAGSSLGFLATLLERWEVADAHWDAVTVEAVRAAGAEDEYALLMRDEIVLALAFAELVEDGRIDPELQRRAHLATIRQALPPVLAPWGDRALERAKRLERMGQVLARPLR